MLRTTKVAKAGGPEDGELSMSAQHHLASGDQSHRHLDARERVLNSAIIAADISRGWEEYLEILDAFYADDVEFTTDAEAGAVRGRERIRTLLVNFLAPLHVMVEIGGLSVQIRESPVYGDAADQTHSAWSVDVIGVSGRTCNLAWCTLRRWADSRVVYERHYDHRQTGGPLTGDDLSLSPSPAMFGDRRPS
jgi:hypothetical protein